MKSLNFVFRSGAVIFLLLVVDPTLAVDGTVETPGTACNGGNTDAGKTCKASTLMQCFVGTAATDLAPTETEHGTVAAAEANDGKCCCPHTLSHWDSGVCKVPAALPGPTDLGYSADCKKGQCKAPFSCYSGGTPGITISGGTVVDITATSDDGRDVSGTEITDTTTSGKCLCPENKRYVPYRNTCELPVNSVTDPKKKHSEACGKLKCEASLRCGVGATSLGNFAEGTADKFGTAWASTDPETAGKCVCEDGKAFKDATSCETVKSADRDETSNAIKGAKTEPPGSGSNRIVYQPITLHLSISAAMGSLFLLWSS